jgi:hypothetical protein
MTFPPRCYYCRHAIRWPFGLVIFWGTRRAIVLGRRRLHVAHRSCMIAHADRRLWVSGHGAAGQSRWEADAFPRDDGFTTHRQ